VKTDDAGVAYGSYARFWVEPDRRQEFEAASDARRAAWVWRRYVTAARAAETGVLEVRYERMTAEPHVVAEELGHHLDAPVDGITAALRDVHHGAVGRYRLDLSDEQLADVLDEAGDLLRELGYVT
jgi:hypothetical protein